MRRTIVTLNFSVASCKILLSLRGFSLFSSLINSATNSLIAALEVSSSIAVAKKFLRGKFAMTPYYCSEHDIRCIEDVLNDNYSFAGSIGSVFSCIGYIIVNEDERWRLRWYVRDPTTLVDAE